MTIKLLLDELAFVIVNRLEIDDQNNLYAYIRTYEELINDPIFGDIADLREFFVDIIKNDRIIGIKNYFISRVRLEMNIKHILNSDNVKKDMGSYYLARNDYIKASKVFRLRNLKMDSIRMSDNSTLKYTKGDILEPNITKKNFLNIQEYAFLLVNRSNVWPITVDNCLIQIDYLYNKDGGFKHEPFVRKFYLDNLVKADGFVKDLLKSLVEVYMYFDYGNDYGVDDIKDKMEEAVINYIDIINKLKEIKLASKNR